MNRTQINQVKRMIQYGDLWGLEEYWHYWEMSPKEYENNSFLFQTFFTHACLHNQMACAQWLYGLWTKFDDVTQSGLRQMFSYCHHLSQKHKNKSLAHWLKGIIQENRMKFGARVTGKA